MSVLDLVVKANARGPTSGFTDVSDDEVNLPENFDRLSATLFKPLRVGAFTLSHRVVHAALGRSRGITGRESPLSALYFAQRTTPGGLIISSATGVSPRHLISLYQVGLQRQDQIDALAHIINAVHDGGGIWFQQLYHTGRASSPALTKAGYDREGLSEPAHGYHAVTASSIGESGINTHSGESFGVPRALTIEEIGEVINDYKKAAINAVKAGADGIEILAGNGFLLDQFLHDNINKRNDIYGGSVENRSRFTLEVVDAVSEVVGYQRIGIRLSPFSNFHETDGSQPLEQILHLAKGLAKRGVAYLSVGEARVSRNIGIEQNLERLAAKGIAPEDISLRPFRKLLREIQPSSPSFNPTVLFGNGGYTSATSLLTVQEDLADGVVIGRRFISNPDIVRRIRYGYPLTAYDRSTFYTHGAKGYVTYKEYEGPVSQEEIHDSPWVPRGPRKTKTQINGFTNHVITNGTTKEEHSQTSNGVKKENGSENQLQAALRSVAIIGAGISGISSASAFRRVGGFKIRIFERKGVPGGSWVYDKTSTTIPIFPGPTPEVVNQPLEHPQGPFPVTLPRSKQQRFTSSPLYENLQANIPYNVMSEVSSFDLPTPEEGKGPFLSGAQISESVGNTAHQYDDLITYNTTLENVEKDEDTGKLTLLFRQENEDGTDTWYTEIFDHLIVATGHNSVPRVPDIEGLESWEGELRHTATWRSGEEFANKKILVVGTSESAIDVSLQSLPHAKHPIYISQRSPHPRYPTVFLRPGIKVVPTISSISGSSIHLSDGEVLTDIDTIVFATGYFFTYPFLSEKIRPRTENGYRVPGLYQHIFDTYNLQSIAFIGVANASLAWATWEKSAFLVALYWAGKISLPSVEEQRDWEAKRLAAKDVRWFHILHPHPERVFYWIELNTLAQEYLENEENVDDDLLRDYPYEWTVSLLAGGEDKKKHYGIVD